MTALLLYFFISHFVSFSCSILEAVLLCCTNGYIGLLKKKKDHAGELLANMKEKIDRPLAAILTLNTAAHTFGAAGVGAQVSYLYGEKWLAFASVGLTLTMLFATEMIPKMVGALYWKQLASPSAYIIRFLIFITYPFVLSFQFMANFLSRGKKQEKITEEEIRHILEEGNQAGVIRETEHDMLESILRLGNRRVNVLMIPRMEIDWIDSELGQEEIKKQIQSSSHSRFPVCKGELDEVVGFLSSKEALNQLFEKKEFDLQSAMIAPLFVPENMRAVQLMDLFKKRPDPIALVIDEYGGIQGLVTLHDVLESIVGNLPTSALVSSDQFIERKDGSWLVDGMVPIDELKERFFFDKMPEEEKGHYRTLGGFCMHQIGKIPKIGDLFEWENVCFKITKMDDRRVKQVLITTLSSPRKIHS